MFVFLAQVVQEYDRKLYDLMEKTKVNQLIEHERPFTTFASAKYLLDRFSRVEQNYLVSKYGLQDLTKVIKHLVISKTIYFDDYPEGESTCKFTRFTLKEPN